MIRKDGKPCKARALAEGAYCFAHAPDLAVRRAGASARGGTNSSKVRRREAFERKMLPTRLVAVYDRLERALEGLDKEGETTPTTASSMASLARAMVTVLGSGEMEERLRNLESVVAARTRNG